MGIVLYSVYTLISHFFTGISLIQNNTKNNLMWRFKQKNRSHPKFLETNSGGISLFKTRKLQHIR